MFVWRNTEMRSRDYFCRGKAVSIKYYECVSVFFPQLSDMQIASFLRRSCELWPVWLYQICPHYLINSSIFGEIVIEYKMCVLIFPITFVWKISYSKII
jgi:hypothetical protein